MPLFFFALIQPAVENHSVLSCMVCAARLRMPQRNLLRVALCDYLITI